MKINKSKNKISRKRSNKITKRTKRTKRNNKPRRTNKTKRTIKKRKEKIIKNVMMGGSTAQNTAFSTPTKVGEHRIIFRHMEIEGPNSFDEVLKVIGSELYNQEVGPQLGPSEIAVIAPGNPENYFQGEGLFEAFRIKFGQHFAQDCRKMPLLSRGNMNLEDSTKGEKINMSGFQLALDENLVGDGWSTPDVGTVGLGYLYYNTRIFTGDARMVCNPNYEHCRNIINVSGPNARDDKTNYSGRPGKKRFLELASSCLRHSLILAHCKGIKLVVCTFISCASYKGGVCSESEILFALYEEAIRFCNLLTTLDPNFKINICFMGNSSDVRGFKRLKQGLSTKLTNTTYNETLGEKILEKISILSGFVNIKLNPELEARLGESKGKTGGLAKNIRTIVINLLQNLKENLESVEDSNRKSALKQEIERLLEMIPNQLSQEKLESVLENLEFYQWGSLVDDVIALIPASTEGEADKVNELSRLSRSGKIVTEEFKKFRESEKETRMAETDIAEIQPNSNPSSLTAEEWEYIEYLYRELNEGFIRKCIRYGYSLNRLMILYGLEYCCPAIKKDFKEKYLALGGKLSDAIPQELSVEDSLEGRMFKVAPYTTPKGSKEVVLKGLRPGETAKMESSYQGRGTLYKVIGNKEHHGGDKRFIPYCLENELDKFEIIEGEKDYIITQYKILKTLQQTAEEYGCGNYVVKVYYGILPKNKEILLIHCDHLPLLVPVLASYVPSSHAFATLKRNTKKEDKKYEYLYDCQHQMYLQDVLNNKYLSVAEFKILTYELIYAVAFVHQCGVYIGKGIDSGTIMLTLVKTRNPSNPTKSSVMITDFSYAGFEIEGKRNSDWKMVAGIVNKMKDCLYEGKKIPNLDEFLMKISNGGVFVLGQTDGYTGSSELMKAMNEFLHDVPVESPRLADSGE
jgi:hypothetical protein